MPKRKGTIKSDTNAKKRRIEDDVSQRHWKAFTRIQQPEEACPAFTEYYRKQFKGLLQQSEWPKFFEALSQPLPVTIRMNMNSIAAAAVDHQLTTQFHSVEDEGLVMQRLKWVPPTMSVWRFNLDRMALRRSTAHQHVHRLIEREMKLGNLSRQEAVSMVPAMFLDVKPEHWVLDMCASPGSKTRQLLEMMQKSAHCGLPSGLLVGNDSDPKRLSHLLRQFSHCGNPALVLTCERGEDLMRRMGDHPDRFDRILCDVPCSGDGTFRKAPELWRTWTPLSGASLHPIQLQLALSGLSLTKCGGKMVYSTCSMNPLEDEAVVAALLKAANGSACLEDASEVLPALQWRPGLATWHVAGCNATPSNMQPPSAGDGLEMHLERCMRILPHDQNTGGFFVAIIKKTGPFKADLSRTVPATEALQVLRSLDFEAAMPPTSTGCKEHGLAPLPPWMGTALKTCWGQDLPLQNLWTRSRAVPKKKKKMMMTKKELDPQNDECRTIHLVSPSVAEFLATFPFISVQMAGSTVFSFPAGGDRLHQLPSDCLVGGGAPVARLLPDGALHVSPFLSRGVLLVPYAAFTELCKLACASQQQLSSPTTSKGDSDDGSLVTIDVSCFSHPELKSLSSLPNNSQFIVTLCMESLKKEHDRHSRKWPRDDRDSCPMLIDPDMPRLAVVLCRQGSKLRIITDTDRIASYCTALETLPHVPFTPKQHCNDKNIPWNTAEPLCLTPQTWKKKQRRRL